jgi:hypothetical protein
MLDQTIAKIVKWIKRSALLKYSIFYQLGVILLAILLVYPYYEAKMRIIHDTGWIYSPNGHYQARVIMKRRFSSHLIIRFILRSDIEAPAWYEIMNVDLVNQVAFKNWPPNDSRISWRNSVTLDIIYNTSRDRSFHPFYEYKDVRVFTLEVI